MITPPRPGGYKGGNLERAIGKAIEESCKSEAVAFGKGTDLLPVCGHVGRELGKIPQSLCIPSILITGASQSLNPTKAEGRELACSIHRCQPHRS